MEKFLYAISNKTDASAVREVRKRMSLTQEEFACVLGSSRPTIERWERSKKPIEGPAAVLVNLLLEHPEYVENLKIPEQVYPLRLRYMYKDKLCTLIDVDENRRLVHIWNYTDHLMFRAFGENEHPDYETYKKFLESRCFPKERDKLKLVLRDLDIPFYDPILIIEKTKGRMAEDDFWIEIKQT